MAQQSGLLRATSYRADPEQLVLGRLQEERRFTVEELLGELPELSWSQLFLAIDVLSRRGDIELHRQGFTYTVLRQNSSMKRTEDVDAATHPDCR